MRGFHGGERFAGQRQAVRADEAQPRPEPGMSINTDNLRSPRAIRASATPPQ